MNKKNLIKIIAIVLAVVVVAGIVLTFVLCGGNKKQKKDSIVIMSEELSGLFNPFYATSGADMNVIGMTQIGMLSTDKEGNTVAGDDQPTVVKAFDVKEAEDQSETVYTFVIKNGLKFSDGVPLTMNDVLFNMYEYLDPVYTGSSTMYSIDIKGLKQYRLQLNNSEEQMNATQAAVEKTADTNAVNRILELSTVYQENGKIQGSQSSYSLSENGMREAISHWEISDGYKGAVAVESDWDSKDFNAMLLEDYEFLIKTFKEELQADFNAAKESFDVTTMPYKEWAKELESDIFKFLVYEGKIKPVYAKVSQGSQRDDKTKILSFENMQALDACKTEQAALDLIYNDNISTNLLGILSIWGTAGTLRTKFAADAKDVLLHDNLEEGNTLKFKNIEGIVSLGHTTNVNEVAINGTTYKVAHAHNADGTPVNSNEYDVLQITVNKVDPKAIYNFGFTVAPAHYYSNQEIDIKNDKFGVLWSDSNFQAKVIQAQYKQEVPVGAGPFMATDENNSDNPKGSDFVKSKVVYFKKNPNFMFEVKAEKLRFQVISSNNALDKLQKGEVDYITPQFTKDNSDKLEKMEKDGFVKLPGWQLGYGYIGVNAGKVPNINIRKAIMSAMQTSLALEYYKENTVKNIDWPISMVSWAYPFEDDGTTSKQNGHDYTQWTGRDDAVKKIKKYMTAAGVSAGSSELKIRFTIAGSSISEHPTYKVFLQAAEILNELGWDVEVKADSQALTKLATGSLAVWAAAWGATIDPDMYQVYHKNSTATSVYAWGYREIKADSTRKEENKIINDLSDLIDQARSTTERKYRIPLYESAMSKVLDLAVEMPVYQRQTLYAFNSNTIKGLSYDPDSNEVNPYSSPLENVWELELIA